MKVSGFLICLRSILVGNYMLKLEWLQFFIPDTAFSFCVAVLSKEYIKSVIQCTLVITSPSGQGKSDVITGMVL